MRPLFRSFTGFFIVIAGALALAAVFNLNVRGTGTEAAIRVETTPVNRDAKFGASYAAVVKKASPSVVNIYTTRIVHMRVFQNPFFNDPIFRQFFGDRFGFGGNRVLTQKHRYLGSGVIVSPDGYILTASHVVAGADEVKVKIADKKEYTARVVGKDPPTDVAVLKIDAKDLPAITLADSDRIEVGDVVLAIGNPFGFSRTVTMGIISALGRSGLRGFSQYQDFIQTDAPINEGNSGGALIDAEGRLIGINDAIFSPHGGNLGIGFAVPVNMARYVMDHLIRSGKVIRGNLEGVLIQDVTSDLAEGFNLAEQHGALVADVYPDSGAQKAGIKSGDVITAFNGKDVADAHALQLLVSEAAPGSRATVKLIRNGAEKTITVTLTELRSEIAPEEGSPAGDTGPEQTRTDSLDGVTVANLEKPVRLQLKVPDNIQGVLVYDVDPESNSADAGLQRGDLILEINRQPVQTTEEAVKFGRQAKTGQILLKIWRRENNFAGTQFISVDNVKKRK
jgi:serine protease Do